MWESEFSPPAFAGTGYVPAHVPSFSSAPCARCSQECHPGSRYCFSCLETELSEGPSSSSKYDVFKPEKESRIDVLGKRIAALEKRCADLKERVDKLEGRTPSHLTKSPPQS